MIEIYLLMHENSSRFFVVSVCVYGSDIIKYLFIESESTMRFFQKTYWKRFEEPA